MKTIILSITAFLALLVGLLLFILPVSPYDHYWYSGYVLVDTPQQLEQFQTQYLLNINQDRAADSVQHISRFSADNSTVYYIELDTWNKLNLDGCRTNLQIQEIHENHWWVKYLAILFFITTFTILFILFDNYCDNLNRQQSKKS